MAGKIPLRLIIALFHIFFLTTFLHGADAGSVRKGLLDLSDVHSLKSDPVIMEGEWAFYPGSFEDPRECNPLKASHYIDAPGIWNHLKVGGKPFGGKNIGTYAVKVLLPRGDAYYALKVQEMATAFDLYIDGRKMGVNGVTGGDVTSSVPAYRPLEVTFHAPRREVLIVFHISNFHHIKGGMWDPVILGTPVQIRRYSIFRQFFELFLLGGLFLLGLYHLILFKQRKRERAAVFLAGFCFVISARIPVVGDHLLIQAFPDLPWMFYLVTEYLTFPLGVVLFTKFSLEIFPHSLHRFAGPLLVYSSLFYCLVILVAPIDIFMTGLLYYQWIPMAGIIYFLAVLMHALIKRSTHAVPLSIGTVLFFGSFIFEFLYTNQMVNSVIMVNTTSIGLMTLTLSQAYVLSQRYKYSMDMLELLSEELEEQVEERTRNLQEALHSINESLRFAQRVQRATLPETLPGGPGYRTAAIYIPAEILGGDFYNFHTFRDGNLGVFIADVAGHGVAASLIASMVNILFAVTREYGEDPQHFLGEINRRLAGRIENHFVTAAYCFIDMEKRVMKYARGGHEPLIVQNRNEKSIRVLQPGGMLLGYRKEIELEELSLELKSGDRIILYTDCAVEAENYKNEMFGKDRFLKLIEEEAGHSAREFVERVKNELETWTGKPGFFEDDLTMVVVDIESEE